MTNRIPLIVNAGAAQIQEIAASDTLQVPGTLTANVVQTDNYQYANGQPFSGGANVDFTQVSSNIIPSANVTYSLGNATNQWLDLWVSNATIYLNSIPLGVSGNGVLQFDGNDLVTSGPNVVNTGNVETTGNISGSYVLGNGAFLTGLPAGYSNADVATFLDNFGSNSIFTTGNITVGNATLGTLYSPNFYSNAIVFANANGYVTNTNLFTYNPTTEVLSVGNITTTGDANLGGNVIASNVTSLGKIVAGTFETVAGNMVAGNITANLDLQAGNALISNAIIAINISATGNANIGGDIIASNVTSLGKIVAGTFESVAGNMTAGNITANLDLFAGNAVVSNSVISIDFTAFGNANINHDVTANYFIGNGSNLSNINGSNVVGAVSLASAANVAYSVDGANVVGEVAVANTVSNPNQPNITALGTITSLTANAFTLNGTMTANGNAQFNADVYFAGNVTIPGNINQISGNSGQFFGNAITGFGALYAGLPAGYTLLNNEVMQFADSYDGYTQVTHRNINSGSQATTDYVATADNGDDTTNYLDLGIAGSGYDGALANNSLGTSLFPNDSYLYAKGNVTGGNLILGSNQANGVVRIIVNGASNIGDVVATFSANGLSATSFTGNGAGVANVDAITLQGAAPNTASSVNTIVQRDSGGRVSAAGFNTAGTYLGEGNVYTESWLVANNMGVETYQLNVSANANITGNLSASYAVFNDVLLNDLSANSILYTDANRNVWNTDFTYDPSINVMNGGNISVTGNVTAGNIVSPTLLLLGSTSTITTSAGASAITVDPNGTGYSTIVVPTFQDGGEQLVIKNQFNSSNGVSIVTETGLFHFLGNSVIFPDGTTQSTAFTGGGSGNTGNVTFNDITIQGTGDEYGGSGLYLAPGVNSTANLQYLRVRGGDFPTHIHFDTGNNQYFDQYFGADNKFVKLEANGNVVINADDLNGNAASWTFDVTGVLTLPSDGMIQSVNNNINISTGVYSWTFDNLGRFNAANLSILSGNGLGTVASIIEDNGSLNVLANGTGGTTQVGWLSNTYSGLGDTAVMIFNEVGNTGNAIIRTGNTLATNYSWTFGNDGNLTLPGNTFSVNYANGTPVTLGGGNTNSISYGISNVTIPIADGNVQINAGVSGWTFTDTGAIVLPSGGTEIQADRILGQVNENFQITIQDQDNDGWTFQTTIIDGLGNTYSQTALERDTFRIYTNLAATSHQWSFDNSGRFNLPGNIQGNYGGDVSLYILNGLGVGNVEMKTVNYSNDTLLSNVTVKDNTVTISTNNSGNTWTFDNTGNLTLPSNTFQVNYANGTPVTLGSSSVAEAPFTIITNDFNATAGSRYGIDTTGGGWIATLPASPTNGDAVFFADAGGAYSTNPFVVNPGLNTIMGAGGSMTVTTNGQSFGLFWNGTTWRTYN